MTGNSSSSFSSLFPHALACLLQRVCSSSASISSNLLTHCSVIINLPIRLRSTFRVRRRHRFPPTNAHESTTQTPSKLSTSEFLSGQQLTLYSGNTSRTIHYCLPVHCLQRLINCSLLLLRPPESCYAFSLPAPFFSARVRCPYDVVACKPSLLQLSLPSILYQVDLVFHLTSC